MVANGCFLEEAFGEIKTQNDNKVKRKKKKERGNIEFDKNYNSMSNNVGGYIEDEEMFSEISQKNRKEEKKVIEKIEHLKQEDFEDHSKNKEYRRLLQDKDYQDYLNYQKNRANYVNNIQTVEGFSNINDNFNDVLLFGLLGIFFLIFTDYIYKLGKRSY
jgi:ABC-type siderophore export system fused ATPase/permease subunit